MGNDLNEAQLLMTAVAALGIGKQDPQNQAIRGAQGVISNSKCLNNVLSAVQEYTAGPGVDQGYGMDACYVAETASSIILAFRGTLGQGTDIFQDLISFLDWLNDFNAEPIQAPEIPIGRVHSGFYQSVVNLKSYFINDIRGRLARGKKKVVITGYSKGAGMAPLAACILLNSGIHTDEVHLYEPPRCGDGFFATAYSQFVGNTTRYEYQDDLVPHTPPTGLELAILDKDSVLKAILHTLYPDIDSWNYSPVGDLKFVNWDNQVVSESDDLEKQRMQHLASDFANNPKAPLLDHQLNLHLFTVLMKACSCDCTYPTWVDGPGTSKS